MKVKDLINELEKYNPNAEVSLVDSEDIMLSFISEENGTPLTTWQVFIEGCDFDFDFEDKESVIY